MLLDPLGPSTDFFIISISERSIDVYLADAAAELVSGLCWKMSMTIIFYSIGRIDGSDMYMHCMVAYSINVSEQESAV